MNATEAYDLSCLALEKKAREEISYIAAKIEEAARNGKHCCDVLVFNRRHAELIREWCKDNSTDTHEFIFTTCIKVGKISWMKMIPSMVEE